jgi:hypothetical protein
VTLGLFHALAGRIGGMEEKREKRGGAGAITLVGAILVLLPILYFLSAGPIIWLAWKDCLPLRPVMFFYSPLHDLGQHCEPFGRLIFGYESLFVPPPNHFWDPA